MKTDSTKRLLEVRAKLTAFAMLVESSSLRQSLANLSEDISFVISNESDREECQHKDKTPKYDHIKCDSCGSVLTDGDWGVASRKWFKSLDVAKFYQKNGRHSE